MRSLRAGGSAIRSFLRRGACVEDAHALGVRLRLRCAAAQPCVGSRRAGCRSAKVNETQGGLRDAAEYSTGDAPAAAARRPLSGLHAAAGLGCAAAVRLAVPHGRWTLGARRRRGAACRHPKQTPCCHRGGYHWHQLPKCRYGWCQRVTPGRNARRQAPPHFRVGADGPRAVSTRATATTTNLYAR
jgi:hypothetical protein